MSMWPVQSDSTAPPPPSSHGRQEQNPPFPQGESAILFYSEYPLSYSDFFLPVFFALLSLHFQEKNIRKAKRTKRVLQKNYPAIIQKGRKSPFPELFSPFEQRLFFLRKRFSHPHFPYFAWWYSCRDLGVIPVLFTTARIPFTLALAAAMVVT